jgi:hypothetical protein
MMFAKNPEHKFTLALDISILMLFMTLIITTIKMS